MAHLGEKIAIAREAKEPIWSQGYLANLLDGQLDMKASQWLARIKRLETGDIKKHRQAEHLAISDVLGTSREWQTTEDDKPVQWRKRGETTHSIERVPVINDTEVIQVPYWGYVPSWHWRQPENDMKTVPTTYKGSHAQVSVRIRGDGFLPRFRPNALILIANTGVPVHGAYNLVLSPDGQLGLGILRKVGDKWYVDFPDTSESNVEMGEDWRILGHAFRQEETDEGGLRP